MKERENETGTYKPINKTLIFVLSEAALMGKDAQLITETLTRNFYIFWNGQDSYIHLFFTFFLIIKIIYVFNILQNT